MRVYGANRLVAQPHSVQGPGAKTLHHDVGIGRHCQHDVHGFLLFRFKLRLRLFRLKERNWVLWSFQNGVQDRVSSPREGSSIFTTSAPMSPIIMVQKGPASVRVRSTTLRSCNAAAISTSFLRGFPDCWRPAVDGVPSEPPSGTENRTRQLSGELPFGDRFGENPGD